MKKRIMIFGTFDIFHPGHLDFIRQAKKFGDCLIVVVSRDENVIKIKGKKPIRNEIERLNQLKVVSEIDQAVLGSVNDKYHLIRQYQPAVICIGYDQSADIDEIKRFFPLISIIRLKPFHEEKFKSSRLHNYN